MQQNSKSKADFWHHKQDQPRCGWHSANITCRADAKATKHYKTTWGRSHRREAIIRPLWKGRRRAWEWSQAWLAFSIACDNDITNYADGNVDFLPALTKKASGHKCFETTHCNCLQHLPQKVCTRLFPTTQDYEEWLLELLESSLASSSSNQWSLEILCWHVILSLIQRSNPAESTSHAKTMQKKRTSNVVIVIDAGTWMVLCQNWFVRTPAHNRATKAPARKRSQKATKPSL